MDNFLDERLQRKSGLFPELVFFDCFACHHSLHNLRWQARESVPLEPGTVRFNDSNLLMLQQIMKQVDVSIADALSRETRKLHRASARSIEAMQKVAEDIRGLARQSEQKLLSHQFEKTDMLAIINNLTALAVKGDQRDYASAEQGVMAVSIIINSMDSAGLLSEQQRADLTGALDRLYAPLADEDRYDPKQLTDALKALKKAYR
jgi:hypothetical protein